MPFSECLNFSFSTIWTTLITKNNLSRHFWFKISFLVCTVGRNFRKGSFDCRTWCRRLKNWFDSLVKNRIFCFVLNPIFPNYVTDRFKYSRILASQTSFCTKLCEGSWAACDLVSSLWSSLYLPFLPSYQEPLLKLKAFIMIIQHNLHRVIFPCERR